MSIEQTEAWENLEEPGLRDVKIKPLSFLIGIIFGTIGIDQKLPYSELEQELFKFSLPLLGIYPIIYKDNRAGGRNHEDALYNSNLCTLNYFIGYGLGLGIKNILN